MYGYTVTDCYIRVFRLLYIVESFYDNFGPVSEEV